ncbi:MAG TPA: CBS domain-containing protein [Longimicrobiales bacterium]
MREMKAAELMTPDPIVVERGTTIADAARELREHDIGCVPVVESRADRRLLGIITDRDIAVRCVAAGHQPQQCAVDQHMTRDVHAVRAGDDVARVMDVMKSEQVRRVPVLDPKERVIGIIAQADLAVDAVEEQAVSPLDVADTLERISEPAHPERKSMH